ncbi:DUF5681 domain-containing protein [Mesorhizobium japonicum]|uniref:Mll4040 protein n=1 Tax=Mesorhizobium japonicum (strain LMG 29417 / CECT 9101 / MAFF 303099) TaxID=266835 RepID=Q98EX4_RHILO|nr:DUF5681 domain-containing protein [Mesorhizobium japonicum]BAB50793.1 mll4040 [Mesorhizobium japonicum MAFF 303099]
MAKHLWKPGVSGNPSGRPKTPEEVKEMLRALTPKAVQRLGEALDGDDQKLRVTAAQEILNRTLGKPHATFDVRATVDNSHAHLQALVSLTALAASPKVAKVLTVDATPALPTPLTIESDS